MVSLLFATDYLISIRFIPQLILPNTDNIDTYYLSHTDYTILIKFNKFVILSRIILYWLGRNRIDPFSVAILIDSSIATHCFAWFMQY